MDVPITQLKCLRVPVPLTLESHHCHNDGPFFLLIQSSISALPGPVSKPIRFSSRVSTHVMLATPPILRMMRVDLVISLRPYDRLVLRVLPDPRLYIDDLRSFTTSTPVAEANSLPFPICKVCCSSGL